MGTDINIYAEVRIAGRWQLAEPVEKNSMWSEEFNKLCPEWKPKELYSVRNRSVFAILANVSNPLLAVTPFDYISKPRGLSKDVSKELADWHSSWGSNAIAESWLMMEELLAFDWNGKQIVRSGKVDGRAAHLFHPGRRGFPYAEWPKGLPIAVGNQGRGVEVTWVETYAEAVGSEFMIDTMNTLRSYGQPKGVRVVFWFDQ
jgi:hypothetical protein